MRRRVSSKDCSYSNVSFHFNAVKVLCFQLVLISRSTLESSNLATFPLQCNIIAGEVGNSVSATSTVDYAKKSSISIGADAMKFYVTLMKEDSAKMSLWARLLARVKK